MNLRGGLGNALVFMLMASFWGLNYSVLKIALTLEPPFVVLFFRILFAFITSIIFILPYSSSLRKINFLDTFILGFFNIFLFMGLWFAGEQTEPASISSILVYTYPIISILFSILFLNEKINKNRIMGLTFGFAGIVIIAANNIRTGEIIGFLLLLFSAVSWSIGTTYFKKRLNDYNVHTVNFLQYAMSLPLVAILLVFERIRAINLEFIGLTFYMGFFGTSVAYLIYLYLIGKYGIARVNPFLFLVPALGTAFSIFINKEAISLYTILGLTFVGIGVFLSFRNK